MNTLPAPTPAPRGKVKFIVWMVLLACVFGGFIWLGQWQVYRYHLKVRIVRDIATRVHAPPVAAPGPAAWPRIAAGNEQYLHVRLQGRFTSGDQTLVHGSSPLGYGFWVMTPFKTLRGFIVLVNRGYIPPSLAAQLHSTKLQAPAGEVTLTGLLRFSEPGGGFMRPNDPARNLWYSCDVATIATTDHLPADHVAPYFVDSDASANGNGLPIAGLTSIHIYNHSLGYAITWYLLALGTLLAAGIVVRHEWQNRH
ncbi:MAG: SURF1 family protein [Rhodanobacteraceae bacterium]